MKIPTIFFCVAVMACSTGAAVANEAYCKRQGRMDQNATQTLQQVIQRTDKELQRFMTGTWYFETRSPSTNQISYTWYTFGPDFLFGYQNRVCATTGCNDYQGVGVFGGIPSGNGQYTIMLSVSDQSRDHECTGFSISISGNAIRDSAGQFWQRVR